MIITLLEQMNFWHWLAFGLALLLVELLGTAGYFLWLGLSGLIVGILLTFIPMSWQLQWISFAVFSLVTTWLWWRKQLSTDKQSDDQRELNQKHKQLIGQRVKIEQETDEGTFRVKLGDTTWSAYTEETIPAKTMVEVVDVKGIVLHVKPVEK
ncbi:NfeD family protein [Vibrio maerlii]|uniref:NfeD family protein n=1 Tax=Vibrio maerlii TaxID=2231648 RepID=UPI0019D2AAD9|nr:NfeD family protein [Vibrio maerlii]